MEQEDIIEIIERSATRELKISTHNLLEDYDRKEKWTKGMLRKPARYFMINNHSKS